MADANVVRETILFRGRVQGVGFRYTAKYAASGLGLTGWVKNLWDGSVLMEVQGEPELIDRLLVQIQNARFIRVDKVRRSRIPLEAKEKGFHVMEYGGY